MTRFHPDLEQLIAALIEHLDVPRSYYERAAERHRSLGEWLHRDKSLVVEFDPEVRPQGSFRYGTVIRPLNEDDEYDLDNVCLLQKLGKSALTQAELKWLYGEEIKAYARAHNMLSPVTEHNRCWRLQYADEVNFHLDTLPCVPEDPEVIRRLQQAAVASELATRAVAITDRRHPQYEQKTTLWPSSNPRGFARWFEQQAALGRQMGLTENRAKASIEDVPAYEWKTTLQRSIQILKRHRDVMYRKNSDIAPISMIITNLAARTYLGESDLASALTNIIEGMTAHVRSQRPRVPNPADPAEDYADKWATDVRLENAFWQWHAQVKRDVADLSSLLANGRLEAEVRSKFAIDLTAAELGRFASRPISSPAVVRSAPAIIIPSAPKPWGRCG
jgi:hypothetical protein